MQQALAALCNAESSSVAAALYRGAVASLDLWLEFFIHSDMDCRGFQYVASCDPTPFQNKLKPDITFCITTDSNISS